MASERRRGRRPPTVPFVLGLFLLAGCGRGAAESTDVVVRSDRQGVETVVTHGDGLFGPDLFGFRMELELVQDASTPASLLSRPTRLIGGPDGTFVVEDVRGDRIVVFGSDGRYLRDLGRVGSGPGEYVAPRLGECRGDTVRVFDFQMQRTTLFGIDGSVLSVQRTPPLGGLALDLSRTADGRFVIESVVGRDEGEVGWSSATVTVLTSDGADTLAHLATRPLPSSALQRIQIADGSYSTMASSIPYMPNATATYAPGYGILLIDGDRPELSWYRLDGTLRSVWIAEIPRHAVPADVRRRFPTAHLPDEAGLFDFATVDDAGRVWVLDLWSVQQNDPGGLLCHVFGADGAYWGTCRVPSRRFTVSGNRLFAIVSDDASGEQTPAVFSIVPSAAGLEFP